MNTKSSVTVLFLYFLTLFNLTDCNTCQTKKLEGDSLIFKLTDSPLKDDDKFTIKKDNKIVQRNNNVKTESWILKNSVLELQHVKLTDSGKYSIQVYEVNGTEINSYSEFVCVYAKVLKPRVNITCQNEKVDFRCDVEGDKDLTYSWYRNGKEMKNAASNVLPNIDADNSEYTCTVQNPVHNSTSDPVEAACFKSDTHFGFDFWTIVRIITTGKALVLLFMTVLVTVDCCDCKRRRKQQREEGFSLKYINTSLTPLQTEGVQSDSRNII